jgi:DNA-binding beta-propeller fold protein YncE
MRKHLAANCLAVAAIFLAAVSSTPIARGAVSFVKAVGTYGSSAGLYFETPTGIAISPITGQVYVADEHNNRVQVLDTNLSGATSLSSTPIYYPYSVGFDPSGLLYVPTGSGPVNVYNGSTPESYSIWAGLLSPWGMAANSTGQIYITDAGQSLVWQYNTNWSGPPTYTGTLAAQGGGTGQCESPEGVAVSPTTAPTSGRIYVVDQWNFRVLVFGSGGSYQSCFGSYGSGPGQFNFAYGVAVSGTGNVYVADAGNNRVEVFNSSGVYQTSFGSAQGLSGPQGVAVSPTGEIYVTSTGSTSGNQIYKYFDPNEWVSGTPHFGTEGAAVGPGQILGTSLTMGASQGLQVDGALTVQSGGYLFHVGNVQAGSFTNNGVYTISGGTLTVSGGTVTNNATMTLSGGSVTAGQLTNNYGASLNAAGTVTGSLANQGTLTQTGQLSVSGAFTNSGIANLAAGQQLLASGGMTNSGTVNLNGGAIAVNFGTFTNSGLVALNGGAITGYTINNPAGGTIRGDGTIGILSPALDTFLTNQGGLIYANGTNGLTLAGFLWNSVGGELRVADGDSLTVLPLNPSWTNSSTITLQGPNASLNGGTLFNSQDGTISGQGRVTNNISLNYGTIRAVAGQLALCGSVTNGAAANPAGTIESAAGTSIVVSQGLALNSGLIALTGGSFSNGGFTMSNNGSILGNGTFSTGGLYNSGTVTLSDGNSSIFGPVTNNSGGTISTYGTSAATTIISFYGPVINNAVAGAFQINSSTARFLGGYTGNGPLVTDPADVYFTGLTLGTSGTIQGGTGDRYFVTAPFTSAGQINLGGNSQMVVASGGTMTQTAGTLHLGPSATLTAGTVQINGGTLEADGPAATIAASLVYASPAKSTYQGILTGSGNSLIVDNPAAELILGGTGNYTGGTTVEEGLLVIDSSEAIPSGSTVATGVGGAIVLGDPTLPSDGTSLGGLLPGAGGGPASPHAVPEPGTLVLLAAACGLAAVWLRRKGLAIRD